MDASKRERSARHEPTVLWAFIDLPLVTPDYDDHSSAGSHDMPRLDVPVYVSSGQVALFYLDGQILRAHCTLLQSIETLCSGPAEPPGELDV